MIKKKKVISHSHTQLQCSADAALNCVWARILQKCPVFFVILANKNTFPSKNDWQKFTLEESGFKKHLHLFWMQIGFSQGLPERAGPAETLRGKQHVGFHLMRPTVNVTKHHHYLHLAAHSSVYPERGNICAFDNAASESASSGPAIKPPCPGWVWSFLTKIARENNTPLSRHNRSLTT